MCNTCSTANPRASLGTIANKDANPQYQELKATSQQYRNKIHNIRSMAGKIIGPDSRTARCGCHVLSRNHGVSINKVPGKDGKEFLAYSGLETCGSVWACPVCAYKVSKKRGAQVKNVIDNVLADGGQAGMLTLTLPHSAGQSCEDTLNRLRKVWKKTRENRHRFAPLKSDYQYIGYISRLEVTYGKNGWHPHLHIILFSHSSSDDHAIFAYELGEIWRYTADKEGSRCGEHGVKYSPVHSADGAADYLAKWNIVNEITNTTSKKSQGGRTPFKILVDLYFNESPNHGRDVYLFREYANTFKGKRLLNWSRGLKDEYCTLESKDKTDEELAQEVQNGELICNISTPLWYKIIGAQASANLLNVIESHGLRVAIDFLRSMGISCKLDHVTLINDSG